MEKWLTYFKLTGDTDITDLQKVDRNDQIHLPKGLGYIEEGWHTADYIEKIEKELARRGKLKFTPKILEEKFTDKGLEYRVESNFFKGVNEIPREKINAPLDEIIVGILRRKALSLLRACDWTQVTDEPFPTQDRKLWRDYRTYLRFIDEIWMNRQIKEPNVMRFEEWKENKPIFRPGEIPWYMKGK